MGLYRRTSTATLTREVGLAEPAEVNEPQSYAAEEVLRDVRVGAPLRVVDADVDVDVDVVVVVVLLVLVLVVLLVLVGVAAAHLSNLQLHLREGVVRKFRVDAVRRSESM